MLSDRAWSGISLFIPLFYSWWCRTLDVLRGDHYDPYILSDRVLADMTHWCILYGSIPWKSIQSHWSILSHSVFDDDDGSSCRLFDSDLFICLRAIFDVTVEWWKYYCYRGILSLTVSTSVSVGGLFVILIPLQWCLPRYFSHLIGGNTMVLFSCDILLTLFCLLFSSDLLSVVVSLEVLLYYYWKYCSVFIPIDLSLHSLSWVRSSLLSIDDACCTFCWWAFVLWYWHLLYDIVIVVVCGTLIAVFLYELEISNTCWKSDNLTIHLLSTPFCSIQWLVFWYSFCYWRWLVYSI